MPPILMNVVTLLAMMVSAVTCYDDHSGFCAGPEGICRYSPNMLPTTVTQYGIYFNFFQYAFNSPAVCRRLDLIDDPNFKVFAYFTCNLPDCYACYNEAARRVMNTADCSGRDGAFITLDGCCLRYETYNFCDARN